MQREEYTVESWCSLWFQSNQYKWNPNTKGGYQNLIEHHIVPCIGEVELTQMNEQMVTDFYEELHDQGLNNRSVWCVQLLLRRCMDEAARDGLISYNPVFLNPKTDRPYQLHEFYYLHKILLKKAGLPWVAFRDLQHQCMEVGI